MTRLSEILAQERRMLEQRREIQALRGEVEKLQTENRRMREAMRRCLSCEYRERPPLASETKAS